METVRLEGGKKHRHQEAPHDRQHTSSLVHSCEQMSQPFECQLSRESFRNDSLAQHTPYMIFSQFLLAWTLVYFTVTLTLLHYVQRRFRVLVTNASWPHILLLDLSCMCYLIVGPIRDILGYETFQCDAELWFRVIGLCLGLAGFSLEMLFYRNKVVLSKLLNQANFFLLQQLISDGLGGRLKRVAMSNSSNNARVVDPITAAADENGQSLRNQIHEAFWYKSKTYTVMAVGSLSILPIIVCGFVFQFTQPFYGIGCVNCLLIEWHYGVILVFASVPIFQILYSIFAMRNEQDPLHSLRDLMVHACMITLCVIAAAIVYVCNTKLGDLISSAVFSSDWIVILGLNLVHTLLVPRHVISTYWRSLYGTLDDQKFDLQVLLQDVDGVNLFTKHLVGEFSAENLRFYTHAKTYRENFYELDAAMQSKRVAEEIFHTFIAPGAILEVNVGGMMKKQIADALHHTKKIDATLFEEAEHEVLRVLEMDSFKRFVKTSEYAAWAQTGLLGMIEGSHHHKIGI